MLNSGYHVRIKTQCKHMGDTCLTAPSCSLKMCQNTFCVTSCFSRSIHNELSQLYVYRIKFHHIVLYSAAFISNVHWVLTKHNLNKFDPILPHLKGTYHRLHQQRPFLALLCATLWWYLILYRLSISICICF